MKNVFKSCLVVLLTLSAFSCSNEDADIAPVAELDSASPELISNLSTLSRTDNTTNQDASFFEDYEACITFGYPLTLMVNGTQVVINNEQEHLDFLAANNGTYELLFPVNVILFGEATVLNDGIEFLTALSECAGYTYPTDACFTVNYPAQVESNDGTITTVNSAEELALVQSVIGYAYPLSVTLADGTVATVNSNQEYDNLYNDCLGIEPCDDCFEDCFDIVYPMNVVSDSGEITTLNSDEELNAYIQSLVDFELFIISYPLTLQYNDGSQITVNSDDELQIAFDDCF